MANTNNKSAEVAKRNLKSKEHVALDGCFGNLSEFYNNADLSDIVLKLGNQSVYAHRAILAANSEYLRDVFLNTKSRDFQRCELVLEESRECKEVFGDFVKFLYSGRVVLNNDNLMPLYRLADKYRSQHLRRLCEHYIRERIEATDYDAAITWLSFAEEYSEIHEMDKIVYHLYDILRVNFHKVISGPILLRLQVHQLCKLLDSWKVVVENEYVVYTAVAKWIEGTILRNGKKKTVDFTDKSFEPLKCIRPAHLTPDQLISIEKSSGDYPVHYKQHLHAILFEGHKYHSLRNSSNPLNSTVQKHPRLYTNPIDAVMGSTRHDDSISIAEGKWVIIPEFMRSSEIPPDGQCDGNSCCSRGSYSISQDTSEQWYIRYTVKAFNGIRPDWNYYFGVICFNDVDEEDGQMEIAHVVTSTGKVPSDKTFTMISPAHFPKARPIDIACVFHVW